jgi:hypothetical protein
VSAASLTWERARSHLLEAIAALSTAEADPAVLRNLQRALAEVDELKREVTAHEDFHDPEFRKELDRYVGKGLLLEDAENARKAIRKARRRVDALYADEEDITEHFAESAKALHWANFWIDAVLKQAKRLPEPRSRRLAEAPPEVKP